MAAFKEMSKLQSDPFFQLPSSLFSLSILFQSPSFVDHTFWSSDCSRLTSEGLWGPLQGSLNIQKASPLPTTLSCSPLISLTPLGLLTYSHTQFPSAVHLIVWDNCLPDARKCNHASCKAGEECTDWRGGKLAQENGNGSRIFHSHNSIFSIAHLK